MGTVEDDLRWYEEQLARDDARHSAYEKYFNSDVVRDEFIEESDEAFVEFILDVILSEELEAELEDEHLHIVYKIADSLKTIKEFRERFIEYFENSFDEFINANYLDVKDELELEDDY